MSCHEYEELLEAKFEEGLDAGLSDTEAEKYALSLLEENVWPIALNNVQLDNDVPEHMKKIIDVLYEESLYFESDIHGMKHWKAVEQNGRKIAALNGACIKTIEYFSVLHDCMRDNEGYDPGHGPRGAKFARQHRDLIELDDAAFEVLCTAIATHTEGRSWFFEAKNPVIATCWDADRLDIDRIAGIQVDPNQLITNEARFILKQRQS